MNVAGPLWSLVHARDTTLGHARQNQCAAGPRRGAAQAHVSATTHLLLTNTNRVLVLLVGACALGETLT